MVAVDEVARRGCSANGKDIIVRCLVKLEVILRCVYSAEFHECTSALRERVESQELASVWNGFIVSQIDKKLKCLGRELASRSFRDFRSVARSSGNYATPHDRAALLGNNLLVHGGREFTTTKSREGLLYTTRTRFHF